MSEKISQIKNKMLVALANNSESVKLPLTTTTTTTAATTTTTTKQKNTHDISRSRKFPCFMGFPFELPGPPKICRPVTCPSNRRWDGCDSTWRWAPPVRHLERRVAYLPLKSHKWIQVVVIKG